MGSFGKRIAFNECVRRKEGHYHQRWGEAGADHNPETAPLCASTGQSLISLTLSVTATISDEAWTQNET
jgi:hypothetical protein